MADSVEISSAGGVVTAKIVAPSIEERPANIILTRTREAMEQMGDGLTDVYVCSYNRYGTVMPNSWYRATNGTTNLLFINRGDGTFREAARERGVDD